MEIHDECKARVDRAVARKVSLEKEITPPQQQVFDETKPKAPEVEVAVSAKVGLTQSIELLTGAKVAVDSTDR